MIDHRSERLAEAFEAQRDRLRSVAYRVLGSHADAEDVVQEAWIRLVRQDGAAIGNLPGWLTTVVGRISLDVLRSRQARPEDQVELVARPDEGLAPDEQAALADSVGLALLVVLDSLTPGERLAFVLHDMFAVSFQDIGHILGKSAGAAKMIASRARRKVRAADRPAAPTREHREVVAAFHAAAADGDFEGLLRALDPGVRLTVDTADGPVVVLGATEVASGARMFAGQAVRHRPVLFDGEPADMTWRADGTPLSVAAFTVADGRITAIHIVTDPARLCALGGLEVGS